MRKSGMRMTEQRRVIARVLDNAIDHPDVEELYARSVKIDSNISISTVYRTVSCLKTAASSNGMISAMADRAMRPSRKSIMTT